MEFEKKLAKIEYEKKLAKILYEKKIERDQEFIKLEENVKKKINLDELLKTIQERVLRAMENNEDKLYINYNYLTRKYGPFISIYRRKPENDLRKIIDNMELESKLKEVLGESIKITICTHNDTLFGIEDRNGGKITIKIEYVLDTIKIEYVLD